MNSAFERDLKKALAKEARKAVGAAVRNYQAEFDRVLRNSAGKSAEVLAREVGQISRRLDLNLSNVEVQKYGAELAAGKRIKFKFDGKVLGL
jgi:hypothetical protein